MNKLIALVALCFLIACNNAGETTSAETGKPTTDQPQTDTDKKSPAASAINWNDVPELKEIGDFPFVTAPDGINVYDFSRDGKRDGISDLFELKKMEVYTGSGIASVEGKLAVLFFMEDVSNNLKYDQYIFDRSFQDYFNKIGAKKIYEGKVPEDESVRAKLKENSYEGSSQTYGLSETSPFLVYLLKNKGKNYVIISQSSSASGQILVMEQKDFTQTITAYKAEELKKELDEKGKAVLYINFDVDKATLKPDAVQVIDEIGKVLGADAGLKLSIEGHTDNTGDAGHNKTLSRERAEAVVKGLEAKGIASGRLQAKGFGAEKPLASNDTEDNKAKNRRVELIKL